jgi:hypothetical protein
MENEVITATVRGKEVIICKVDAEINEDGLMLCRGCFFGESSPAYGNNASCSAKNENYSLYGTCGDKIYKKVEDKKMSEIEYTAKEEQSAINDLKKDIEIYISGLKALTGYKKPEYITTYALLEIAAELNFGLYQSASEEVLDIYNKKFKFEDKKSEETEKRKESFDDLADALRWLADGNEINGSDGVVRKITNNGLCYNKEFEDKVKFNNKIVGFYDVFGAGCKPHCPQKWHEKPFEPCLCWVWNGDEVARPVVIVVASQEEGDWYFKCINGKLWNYAIPLSNEEITKYTFKG